MRIGMLSFAHMHAYTYADVLKRMPNVSIQALADANHERGREAQARYGGELYTDYQKLLQREDIDAVVVCSENALHAEMVVAAAEAGKHVLCEKPIAITLEDAHRMIDACRRHEVTLQIAFPVRFNTPIRQLKDTVDAGRLGRIVAIRGTNHGQNPGGWFVNPELSGGGAVMDHTVHVIDIMRWLLQSEVREVYAEVGTRFSDLATDDCGILLLEFDNGVIASHDPSWSRPKTYPTWGDVTLEVIGTRGVTTVDAFAQHLQVYRNGHGGYQHAFFGDSMDAALIADFVDCVANGCAPSISGEDGLRALEVALAAYESAQTGRPVRLRE
ncbi:Gfo/Idh/MocA family protein [Alicyclobacillus herbarius]|uniref:Gfo/Idh/MocA family protein n=1 Tax=Alicyclobacillus herbarius TaxID=122960 RepID=UPI00047CE103|nr:Gfo/Idh/MocA family oxidoreductase [Alicyclobacillus herbarius]